MPGTPYGDSGTQFATAFRFARFPLFLLSFQASCGDAEVFPLFFVPAYAAVADFMVLVKSGGRFSRNAVSATFASSERTRALNSSFSAFIAASICSRKDRFMSRL